MENNITLKNIYVKKFPSKYMYSRLALLIVHVFVHKKFRQPISQEFSLRKHGSKHTEKT